MKELLRISSTNPEKAAYLAGLYKDLFVFKVSRFFRGSRSRQEKALANIINWHIRNER